ncbi:Pentatricopeptide repeat-containing protein At4g26680, mitochondrial [Linum grandiflorum]
MTVRTLRSANRNLNQIPIPHRSIPEARGQDLDFINVAHSHLIHSDWGKLAGLSPHLTPFRVKHVQLKIQRDFVLSLEFFNWVKLHNPAAHTLETHSIILHVLTKNRKFKSAESITKDVLRNGSVNLADQLFDVLLHSYRLCDSSSRVFDSLFSVCARSKKFRFATEVFRRMKEYGFLPTVESCNAYLSSLLDMDRFDIVFVFYGEMRRCRISPNVYTLNMVMSALCKAGRLEKAVELFREMENGVIGGVSPNVASYNVVIAGYCRKGLLSSAMKLKSSMEKTNNNGNVVTFNTLIHGFCKEGRLQEARKLLSEMKIGNVAPNIVTFNTLMNARGNSCEMNDVLYQEMMNAGIKPDILTYNALIAGLCRDGKTKKAAYLVKELVEKEKIDPTASTFAALISGQCVRNDPDRGWQLYKAMARSGFGPNKETFNVLVDAFYKKKDFEGAVQVLLEMFDKCATPASSFVADTYDGLRRCGMDRLAAKLRSAVDARNLAVVHLETSPGSTTTKAS